MALLFLPISSAFAQSNIDKVNETVTYNSVRSKIEFMASDELRGRDTPSPEQLVAARYLATQLQEYGAKPIPSLNGYYQSVPMFEQLGATGGTIAMGSKAYALGQEFVLLSGSDAQADGKVAFVEFGSTEDFQTTDVKGKIVFARFGAKGEANPRTGFRESREKATRAKEAGALALIEFYNSPQLPWTLLRGYMSGAKVGLRDEERNEEAFLRLLMDDSNNQMIDVVKNFKKSASIKLQQAPTKEFAAYNVVGVVEGTDPTLKNEYMIYSAHYDHVGVGDADATGDTIYNGTRDNAIGTVTVMEAARNIAKYPLKRSAIFIFFTGEEKGLLGSEYYVANPPIPLDKVVMCFNSDNGGYNDTSKATIIGLNRTTATPELETAGKNYGLDINDDPAPEQNLFDRSDQVSFARKGVPAIMFSMGITAFDDEVLKYYHQASDNPDSVDYDYLLKFARTYVTACRLIGNRDQRPYWTAGDKYFEDGQALYGF